MGGYAVYLKQKYQIFLFDSFSLVSLSLALRSRNRNLNLQLLICKLQITFGQKTFVHNNGCIVLSCNACHVLSLIE